MSNIRFSEKEFSELKTQYKRYQGENPEAHDLSFGDWLEFQIVSHNPEEISIVDNPALRMEVKIFDDRTGKVLATAITDTKPPEVFIEEKKVDYPEVKVRVYTFTLWGGHVFGGPHHLWKKRPIYGEMKFMVDAG